MRAALLALIACLAGCEAILGIEDPAAPGTSGDCTPFDTSPCAPGAACDVDPDSQQLVCVDPGDQPVNTLCDGPGQCAAGLTCAESVCRSFCDDGHGCVEPEAECRWDNYGVPVCDSACDFVAQTGCAPGADCIFFFDSTGQPQSLCLRQGYFGTPKAAGEPCSADDDYCGPGLVCDGARCRILCTEANDSVCPTMCDLSVTLHGRPVGVCP